MTICLRPYAPRDAEPTWAVFHRAVTSTAAEHYAPAQIAAWSPEKVDLRGWGARREAAWTRVAVDDDSGTILGFADLTEAGELDMLFVDPAASGRGVARMLVDAVLREARKRGLRAVTVRSSHSARPVLAHLGFVVDRERTKNSVRGVVVPNTDMHIDLGRRYSAASPRTPKSSGRVSEICGTNTTSSRPTTSAPK